MPVARDDQNPRVNRRTNAEAIASYIKEKNPEKVTIVGMGINGKVRADEDWLCARYIQSLIEGKEWDISSQLLELIYRGAAFAPGIAVDKTELTSAVFIARSKETPSRLESVPARVPHRRRVAGQGDQ